MSRRVVITGMGVVAPNGVGLADFEDALRKGRSGIRNVDSMVEAKFACTVAGVPQGVDAAVAVVRLPSSIVVVVVAVVTSSSY